MSSSASRPCLAPRHPPGNPAAYPPTSRTTPPQWHRHSRLPLGALPGAVPCARLHTKHIIKEWHLDPLTDPAELIVSELVTNALHASRALPEPQPIGLRLLGSSHQLMIEVWDACHAPPDPHPPQAGEETGRGLLLVASFSQQWGYYHPTTGGKVVWAILTTPPHPASGNPG
jgi:anti-sigma regulatory factor (Ser/Thr protein kinase)